MDLRHQLQRALGAAYRIERELGQGGMALGHPRAVLTMDEPTVAFGRGTFATHDTTMYFAQLRSESDVWTAELIVR